MKTGLADRMVAFCVLVCTASAVLADPAEKPGALQKGLQQGKNIIDTPARDIGADKIRIPPVLEAAHYDPYGLDGTATCARLVQGVADLNAALGSDFTVMNEKKENAAGKLAEAGGKSLVGGLIPFRGLVREVSGAAPAQRRLNAAIDAGYARRGFLRGIAYARRCRGLGDGS